MPRKNTRTAFEKLGTRIEEGRPVTSVPIPEPRSKVRAVQEPYPIGARRGGQKRD